MRGTGFHVLQGDYRFRITPAHAGNSVWVNPFGDGHGDHPRACGEQPTKGPVKYGQTGSPPRMRGTEVSPKN